MSNINTLSELRNEIQMLENDLAGNGLKLKDQLLVTYELFNPLNLISSALKKLISPSFLIDKLMGPALGLAAGYLFRK